MTTTAGPAGDCGMINGVDDPRRRGRAAAGWTKRHRTAFFEALAMSGNVSHAAQAVGRTHGSAYALRLRDGTFAERWEAALLSAYARLEEKLLSQAIGYAPLDAGEGARFDAALALKMLAHHQARTQVASGKPRAKVQRTASLDEVERSLTRKLAALGKRREVAR